MNGPGPSDGLLDLWRERQRLKFGPSRALSAAPLFEGMTADARVNHVPVITGGRGVAQLDEFFECHFLPGRPKDLERISVFEAAGHDSRVVEEFILSFTHDLRMDWLLPGVEPTGRRVRLPLVSVAQFEGDRIAAERTYWDQATVLVQLGLMDAGGLPVSGAEQAEKVLHPDRVPSNELIWRARGGRWDIPDFAIQPAPPPSAASAAGALAALWTGHLTHEFVTLDAAATIATMVPHAHVNHVPTLTGGTGHEQLRYFYANHFIGQRAPNLSGIPEAGVRTFTRDTLVDENLILGGRHTVANDYALPGVAPTGLPYSRPGLVLVHFEGDKLAHEHIYWDQATTLFQLGLWQPDGLPVTGAEQAEKVRDFDSVASNELIKRARY